MDVTRKNFLLGAGAMAATASAMTRASIGGGRTRGLLGGAFVGALMASQKSGPAARDYVQDGLIAMWDGIENAGWGVHDTNATVWKNLIDGSNNITLENKAHFGENALITDSDYQVSGRIDRLIPWQDIKHAEYQANVLGSPGTSRDRFCSLSTTYRIDGNDLCARCLAWNNNNNKLGLMVKTHSTYNSGVARVPNGVHSYSIGYGSNVPNVVRPQSFYTNGVQQSVNWEVDGIAGNNGVIGGVNAGIYCEFWAIRYYNRVLSDDEVATNYAIDKARFNLP